MKTRITKQGMRNGAIALTLSLFGFGANAQTTNTTATANGAVSTTAGTGSAITKAITSTPGSVNTAVRVVDNKGTIKYFQVQNGMTAVTSAAPTGAGIVTTYQLGGALTDNTYIEAGTGKEFALDGIELLTGAAAIASTNAVTRENAKSGNTVVGTGFTFLVRDEATGATKKLLASDLVVGGSYNVKLDATTAAAALTYTNLTLPVDVNKISVYRNGAKMLVGTDYAVAGTVGSSTITVNSSSAVVDEDYTFTVGDRVEIQWVK